MSTLLATSIGLIFLILAFWSDVSTATERNILYINSYHAEFPWSQKILQGILRELKKAPFQVRLRTEHLDTKRYPGTELQQEGAELIAKRLFGKKFDLVIVSDNNAFNFALSHQEELFYGLPIVFCGVNNFHPEKIKDKQDIIGVAEIPSINETIKVAFKLHPKTEEVIVIGSSLTTSERSNLSMIEEAVRSLPGKVLSQSWHDLSTDKLKQKLLETAENKLLLISGIILDKSGNPLSFAERTSFVRRHSNNPIYSFWEHNLGHGIVGGKLINAEDQGRFAASMAVSILSGKDMDNMEIIYEAPNQFMFDYKEMERFGVRQNDLPLGSKVINSPPTLTEILRSNIYQTIILLLVAITIVIFWRFSTAKNLNRTIMDKVRELKDSERKLVDIINFLPDPTFVINIDGRVITWNQAMEQITGIDKTKIIGKGGYEYAIPFYGKPRPLLIDLALKRDEYWEKDYRTLQERDGDLIATESYHPEMGAGGRYYKSTAARLYDADGKVVGAIETMRDITGRKQSEQEREILIADLQKALDEVKTLSAFLPICASCKKIRDDKGYWSQVEEYIYSKTGTKFSHGICPDCYEKELEKINNLEKKKK